MPKYGHVTFLIAGLLTFGIGWLVWLATVLIQDDHNQKVEFLEKKKADEEDRAWYAAQQDEWLKKKGLK